MNKKIMAVAMAAVMLMVAITVGVSVQSDVDALGTEDDPAYITGTSSTTATVYIDNPTGLKTSIQFNRSAFTDNARVTIYLSGADGGSPGTRYREYTASNQEVTADGKGKISVTITEVGTKSGWYNVSIAGNTAGEVMLKIKITVEERDPASSSEAYFSAQEYYWAANLEVAGVDGSITLSDGSDIVTKPVFNYESNVYLEATASTTSPSGEDGWRYYAIGLPSGLSMKVAGGVIGGKLSKEIKTNPPSEDDMKFTVYAVSSNGVVISTEFEYTLGIAPSSPTFALEINDAEIGDYVLQNEGNTPATVTITGNGASLANVSVKINGASAGLTESAKDYTFNLINTGTGAYEVVVTADVTDNGVTATVQKYFTVYVVGAIVSADLDPSVISR